MTRRSNSANLYARIIVPADLRDSLGKSEIWKSLKTGDKREAQRRAAAVFAQCFAEIEAERRKRSATADDLQQAAFDHYLAELETDRQARALMPKADDFEREGNKLQEEWRAGTTRRDDLARALDVLILKDPLAYARDMRQKRAKVIRDHLAIGETVIVHWAADAVIKREGLEIPKGSPRYIELCQALQRAELEALKRASERDQGEWGGSPADPAIKPPKASQKAQNAKPGETIMDLFAIFKRERRASKSEDTWTMNETIVRLFVSFIGERSHVTAITRAAIRDWKTALAGWPVKAGDIKEFDGLSFKEVIRKNAVLSAPKPGISDRTKNKYLSAMGSFCEWLLINDHIPNDVMRGMSFAETKDRKSIVPYRPEQLQLIFGSSFFTDPSINDWRRWVPLIALFSGARLGEICQLQKSDIRMSGETLVMHITTEGEGGKKTKTAGSQRVVPIHPKLISLGFPAFHKAAPAGALFPELTRDKRGQFGEASRSFGRYFRRIGVKVDRTQNFHSFRHGIADAFRRAGYRDEEFAPLLGHVKGTTTARYGLLREGELSALKIMIDKVEFPGLVL